MVKQPANPTTPDGTVALADVHWTELPQFFGNIGVWAIDATVANKAVCVIYRSDDGGLSWTPAAVERWNPSVILHFVTPQTGWAIAPDQNEWLTSDDGGKTWRPVVSSIRVTSLINIQPLSASQAYAVEILKSGSLRWIVTRDGGKSWGGVAYPFQGADTP
ncbi:hypothetical protein GCM10025858_28930 [Alicyclobacillus sacchari]|uniref:WD40/YVTN/BNR-like repeat-containing protein n=1 Tax=Alicyclobacillus sacchari TaxID=392010 RepID=UPI0023E9EA78|nr:hypothetical protein [Alicyclobacillus sacchari]GMA58390.1 hypothetical protein GCM10025858_28930 [Alicyclobacillus sacchari]